ncbi:P-loop containing nucleoside triphosphate hydrolase protein [Mycena maculata]|uniref:P-loop containing nucleoside triphosphate hydrolase protein n=1 Tax=Mycena maculata TaxID=230809 RepID=A0AAD7HCG2_9AGAR|nr:P-loop containing nucleoside triphosphate hydrolase protein [Mycena maculata]
MAAREVGQGAATTYMSVDVEKVTSGFQTFQELWAAVVTIVVACTLLWYKAGYVMFAPLLFIIALLSTTSGHGGSFVGPAQKAWLAAIDIRIKLLTKALRHFMYLIAVAGTLSNIGSSAARGWGDLPPLDVSRIFTCVCFTVLFDMGFLQLPEKASSELDSVDAVEVANLVDVSEGEDGIKGCAFGWDDKTRVLSGITLELAPRELHMVVGSCQWKIESPMSILGETRLVEGSLEVKAHKIALASQTPFIYPGTLRANILLDSPWDEAFYDKVIHACGLRQDIEALPQRDLVKLGDKGATLSGGQRQRLAIARAVYAHADLVLLDDVFSALDGETEAHVFASLFGPDGMLKGKVRHHHGRGTITHFGSFEQVRDAGATFALASTAASGGQANSTEATIIDEEKEEEEAWNSEQASRRGAYAFYVKCTGFFQTTSLLTLITVWSGIGLFSTAYLSSNARVRLGSLGLWVAGYGGIVFLNLLFMALSLAYFAYTVGTFTAPTYMVELAGNPVGRILNRFSQDIQTARYVRLTLFSQLYTLFGTTVSGLITVRAYQCLLRNESQGALHHRLAGQLFLRVFLLWFQTILACSVAVLTVWLRDTTSAAFLGIALSRLVSLGMWMTHLLTSYASVENGSIAIDRIEEYAKLPEEEKTAPSDEVAVSALSAWPSAGSLAFSDFSMRYRDDLPPALKNLSFELQGGLKIGICGRTGSGKSSTVLSLFRGIDQHLVTGSIVIDGVDISTVPLKKLRESMSIVTQDPFLWHGSIRENLDITNERTDAEIWEALKLDDKLDHLVANGSCSSLARALLRNKKIVVLDESTSSMDHITDEKIRHVVDLHMKGFTVIAIAHRISTIVNYDKILVLDSGSIAEFDNPTVLLSKPESRFARLAATQGIYPPDFVPKGAAVKELDGTVMVVEDLVDV